MAASASPSKSFPGFEHLYDLEPVVDRFRFYADPEELIMRQTELFRGEWTPDATVRAHWAMGRAEPEDIALGRSTCLIYLSPKVQELFKSNGVTGWKVYSMELHNKAGNICPGYAGLSIVGRCGPTDQRGGDVAPGWERPGLKNIQRIGLYFEESTWDGSDFFCPAGENSHSFVTEKVKSLLQQNKIKGVELTPLTKATWFPKVN